MLQICFHNISFYNGILIILAYSLIWVAFYFQYKRFCNGIQKFFYTTFGFVYENDFVIELTYIRIGHCTNWLDTYQD